MILVTGGSGQLASEFAKLLESTEAIFVGKDELDITCVSAVRELCISKKIDTVINCAAYTDVDGAETNSDLASRVNCNGPQTLGKICAELNIFVVHFSTDYVFSGNAVAPYIESSKAEPIGVYGKTKFDGEQEIIQSGCRGIILRISWLYSSHHKNFFTTMKTFTRERDSLSVVYDQVSSPTYAGDVVKLIIQNLSKFRQLEGCEVFHYANEGVCSWYDFAVAINSSYNGNCKIAPILSEEYPTRATRPKYSVLNKAKIKSYLGIEIPHWHESLNKCVEELG